MKKSLTDRIYTKLKTKILKGEYPQGALITENDLASEFGVSKTPIREALGMLKNEGFIDVIPHKGYFIANITLTDIREYFMVRKMIELGLVPQVIENASETDIDTLADIAGRTFDENDEAAYTVDLESNFAFHLQLAKATNNSVLVSVLDNCLNHLKRMLFLDLKNMKVNSIQQDHLNMVDAIRQKNAGELKALLTQHLDSAYERIMGMFSL